MPVEDTKPAVFTVSGAHRIAGVVAAVERLATGGWGAASVIPGLITGFWAKLGNEDPNNAGYYKWSLQGSDDNGPLQEMDPAVDSGDDYTAMEATDSGSLTAGLSGKCVRLYFGGYDIDENPYYLFTSGAGDGGFWIKITGHTAISGDNNRWQYNWTEQTPLLKGTAGDKPAGRSSGTLGVAYNMVEANNAGSGELGSGDNVSDFVTGINEKPIGVGAVVRAWVITNCDTPPVQEVWFSVANNPGGVPACG